MPKRLLFIVPLLLALVISTTHAQDDTTVSTAEDPELGTILTDREGMTLYLFTNDDPGVSNCYDQCEENWPVFTAEEPITLPDGMPGELTLIERNDGTTQVAYNGWPLYYWANDAEPGDTTGHAVGDVWFVVNPAEPGEMAVPGVATPAASPAPSPAAEANMVEVTLAEFGIDMPVELPSGPTVFRITNEGDAPHNFEIEGQGIETKLEENLQGGESGTLEVDLQPGTYEVFCPVGHHADISMELELTVTG
jgi:predicted lipoprotein with Yx(FWY)xxD motif/plastocyanin